MSNIPQQIGNYLLEREIGRGGSGVVWLARHASLEERRVAIKILTDYSREAILRFQREAAIACRLQHPNIVQVYDHGQDSSVYYTVMEYIHGGSLRLMIEKQGRLAANEAMPILKQIAAALDYAHSRQVIHRDVSPGNILIEQSSGRALLTDFGIARQPDKSITVTHHIMGTPGFYSPEHMQSATSVTYLSDVFGLGAVFYFMLSGESPWKDEILPLERIFPAPVPLRERGVTNLPTDIDRVLQTMLANEPAKRFPSAGAAVAELERIFVRHESVTQISTPAADAGDGKHPSITVVAAGIEQNAVETALGPDLVRAPVARAHQRAEDLRRPEFIADLLDDWAEQDRFKLHRQLLGRLARLHKVSSRNVYYYRLRVLYERREKPVAVEQPDLKAEVFPLEPEVDRWQVQLPPVKDFDQGKGKPIVLPGSTRVVTCANCNGKGKIVCPRCKGRQRIRVARELVVPDGARRNRPEARSIAAEVATEAPGNPAIGRRGPPTGPVAPPAAAEPTLVPCPNCDGQGGIRCDRCSGVGRLIQRNVFRWERRQQEFAVQDDLPEIDENWLRQNFEANAIYCERASAGFRPEWSNVPALRDLIDEAQAQADDQNRVVLSEVTIHFIPVSDVVFDLGHYDPNNPDDRGLYKLSIYGFENYIPPDWRFLNWERVIYICAISFISIIAVIFGIFALM